jgi:hypothetical protein
MYNDYYKYARNYDAWLMSNAKWRKTLAALVKLCDKSIDLKICTIDCREVITVRPPQDNDINESRFNDGAYQPFEYKWIEWLLIPRKQAVKIGVDLYRAQNVDNIKINLEGQVKLDSELTNDGLYIVAYKKIRGG